MDIGSRLTKPHSSEFSCVPPKVDALLLDLHFNTEDTLFEILERDIYCDTPNFSHKLFSPSQIETATCKLFARWKCFLACWVGVTARDGQKGRRGGGGVGGGGARVGNKDGRTHILTSHAKAITLYSTFKAGAWSSFPFCLTVQLSLGKSNYQFVIFISLTVEGKAKNGHKRLSHNIFPWNVQLRAISSRPPNLTRNRKQDLPEPVLDG